MVTCYIILAYDCLPSRVFLNVHYFLLHAAYFWRYSLFLMTSRIKYGSFIFNFFGPTLCCLVITRTLHLIVSCLDKSVS